MPEIFGRAITAEAILRLVDKSGDGLRSAERNLGSTARRMEALSKRLAIVGGALTAAVTLPILAWAKDMTKAQIDEERQLTRVRLHLEAVSKSTGLSSAQLERMGRVLSRNSETVNDFGDVMTGNIDILARFSNLHGTTFRRAAQLVEDVSAGMVMSQEEAATRVGKALNNPMASLRALREMGIDFSARQKAQMAQLEKYGQRAVVTGFILQQLEKKWHGQARVLTQTTAGQIMLIGKNMEEFGKGVNQSTLQWIDPLIRRVRRFTEHLKEMPDAQQRMAAKMLVIAAATGPALLALSLTIAAATRIGTALSFIAKRWPVLLLVADAVESIAQNWDEVIERTTKASKLFDEGKYGEGADELSRLVDKVTHSMLTNIPLIGGALGDLDDKTKAFMKSWGLDWSNFGKTTENEVKGLVKILEFVGLRLAAIDRYWEALGAGVRKTVGQVAKGHLEMPMPTGRYQYGGPETRGGEGHMRHRAQGGSTSGWTVTGERGPELAYHGPGWIHSADKLSAIMAMLQQTSAQAIRPDTAQRTAQREQTERIARPLEKTADKLNDLTRLLERYLQSQGAGGPGGSGSGADSGGGGGGGGGGVPRETGGPRRSPTYTGIGGRTVPRGHHPGMHEAPFGAGPGGGDAPDTGPVQGAGTYRKPYKLSAADLDPRVINTIAGEATSKRESRDAVINNMLNRVGTKGWGPSDNLLQVARAPGQYAGYRRASEKESAAIIARMREVASGAIPDPTKGANTYRAAWYGNARNSPWFRKYGQYGTVVGGNRFAYDPHGGRGPYSPYSEATVAENLSRARDQQTRQQAAAHLDQMASQAGAERAGQRGINIGKGSLDVNLRVEGPGRVTRVRSNDPENLALNTGVDRTGAPGFRPGGMLGPV